ncbi:hypothetical protein BaRGS_00018757 [Batillaria attramentaria]|uniref:Uncharacterized protein n=1 Tax=Batillaria attramentaria TaxID=370345 RepID=A0ABD0KSF5_9CAEN
MKGPLGISRLTCDVRRKHRNFFRFWPKLATDYEAILRKEATMITYIELSVFALLLSITSKYFMRKNSLLRLDEQLAKLPGGSSQTLNSNTPKAKDISKHYLHACD